ncbi:hypothetical protein HDZ31DRAFT_71177 [Schizophyllum fasciatum]
MDNHNREQASAAKEIDHLQRRLKRSKDDIIRLQCDAAMVDRERQLLFQRTASLEASLQSTSAERDELRNRRRCDDDIQKAELEIARRFLQSSDSISEADVVSQLKAANEEIFQIAAGIADSLADSLCNCVDLQERVVPNHQDTQRVKDLVGPQIHRALEGHAGGVLFDVILQSALQACLCQGVSAFIRTWDLGRPDASTEWEKAYARVRRSETSVVSRQWRIMTKRSMRARETPAVFLEQISSGLHEDLAAVIRFARRDTDDNQGEAEAALRPYREKIACLADMAVKLNESIGFGVSSADLAVFAVQAGQPFDKKTMYDFWDSNTRSTQPKEITVAGICSLGLGRIADDGEEGDRSGAAIVLLLAGVALHSVLQPGT